MTDEVLPRRLPHDPNSFGAGLMRSAIEQGFPSVGGKPAPAWTREAPTSDGLFWIRFESGSFEGSSTVAFWVPPFEGEAETLSFDGAEWTLAEAREWYPEFEWWPVRLEPPA